MTLSTDDVVEIEQLAARYNHAVDSGDGAAFAGVFTEDGVLHVGQTVEGRHALTEFAIGIPVRMSRPRHMVSNIVVDGEGDHATLKAYVHIYDRPPGTSGLTLSTTGRYNDTLRRESGQWLFVERTFTPD